MRIVIGGASNGKRAYVRALLKNEATDSQWFEGSLPSRGSSPVVIAGIENWLLETNLIEEDAIATIIERCINREATLILTDIGRGIVPINKKQRWLRDCCGRLYQQLFSEATEITRIWYGIPQRLKGGKNNENLYEDRG